MNQHMHEWVNSERSLNKLKEFLTKMKTKLDLGIRKLRKEDNQTTNGIQAWLEETLMYIFLVLLEHSSSVSSFDIGLYGKNTCPVKNLHQCAYVSEESAKIVHVYTVDLSRASSVWQFCCSCYVHWNMHRTDILLQSVFLLLSGHILCLQHY